MDEISLSFPFAGVDVSVAFCKQPNRPVQGKYSRTTVFGANVRAFDSQARMRGGSRPGLVKYIATRPGGIQYITQSLAVLVTTGGSPVQPSQSGRVVKLIAVSGGNVSYVNAGGTVWLSPTNLTGETPPLNATGIAFWASNIQNIYFADGINRVFYQGSDDTLRPWILTAGDFPTDNSNNTPRLICTWRGRIVMSGILLDPSLIVMSKVSDPLNFEYNPPVPVPPDSAWSGHVGPQGLTGDVITALIPYTDDILIIGMDSSLALFRGDPNFGGSIDNVTTTIGIAWGEAWAMDPSGVVYFFSNRTGVFAFVPGNQPQRISQAIDSILLGVDTGANSIRLQWNDRFQQLHVWITLLTEVAPTTHYVWESRANAWWQDTMVNASMNPLCCVTFDGNEAQDRVALIGSWDGYVRSISSDAETDDGEAIESEIWIGPFLTQYNDSVRLNQIQGILGEGSGDVGYEVYVGQTAESALASSPVASGTWTSSPDGRNLSDSVARSGYAAYLRLISSNAWAMESIRAQVRADGDIRRRGK